MGVMSIPEYALNGSVVGWRLDGRVRRARTVKSRVLEIEMSLVVVLYGRAKILDSICEVCGAVVCEGGSSESISSSTIRLEHISMDRRSQVRHLRLYTGP
jgi:hypothetical protein